VTKAVLDAEALNSYSLIVEVSDTGSPSTSANMSVVITVDSVNEAPVRDTDQLYFQSDAGSASGASPPGFFILNITEGALGGTLAQSGNDGGGLRCVDVDIGDVLRYRELLPEEHSSTLAILGRDASEIMSAASVSAYRVQGAIRMGTNSSLSEVDGVANAQASAGFLFEVDLQSGNIAVAPTAPALNHEDSKGNVFVVPARCSDGDGLFAEVAALVVVSDRLEPPQMASSLEFSLGELSTPGTTIG